MQTLLELNNPALSPADAALTVVADLRWLADRPFSTWIGKNPADGGYACIVDLSYGSFWKPAKFVEGQGDTAEEALRHVRVLMGE